MSTIPHGWAYADTSIEPTQFRYHVRPYGQRAWTTGEMWGEINGLEKAILEAQQFVEYHNGLSCWIEYR